MKKVPVPAPFSIFTILFTGNWPAVCSVYLSRGQLFPVTRIILELQHIICYNEKNMLQGLAYESDNRKTAAYPVLGDGVPQNQSASFIPARGVSVSCYRDLEHQLFGSRAGRKNQSGSNAKTLFQAHGTVWYGVCISAKQHLGLHQEQNAGRRDPFCAGRKRSVPALFRCGAE